MYPTKSRTDIVADLLAAALNDVELSFPSVKGKHIGNDLEAGIAVYEDVGLGLRFRKLVDKHYVAIEKEQGNSDAKALYGGSDHITEDLDRG